MDGVTARLYLDTNVLRYFGVAFARTTLAEDLRDHIVMSPISVLELLAQLATGGADEAFAAIQAIPNVHSATATEMLPSSEDALRMHLFRLVPGDAIYMRSINTALNNCLRATAPMELHDEALELRALLLHTKDEAVATFTNLLTGWRHEGGLPEQEHRSIFARSIATRAGTDPAVVDADAVIANLDALYIYEAGKLAIAAAAPDYNVAKHANDLYDAEQLVYLSDGRLHFLTSDTGFTRSAGSPQFSRIHIVPDASLRDPGLATNLIREILTAA